MSQEPSLFLSLDQSNTCRKRSKFHRVLLLITPDADDDDDDDDDGDGDNMAERNP